MKQVGLVYVYGAQVGGRTRVPVFTTSEGNEKIYVGGAWWVKQAIYDKLRRKSGE